MAGGEIGELVNDGFESEALAGLLLEALPKGLAFGIDFAAGLGVPEIADGLFEGFGQRDSGRRSSSRGTFMPSFCVSTLSRGRDWAASRIKASVTSASRA